MARALLFQFPASGLERRLPSDVWSGRTDAKIMDTRAIEIRQTANGSGGRAVVLRTVLVGVWSIFLVIVFAGCNTEFMQNVKSAATEMTTPAPVLGPYDPPPPSPWGGSPAPPAPAPSPATAPSPAPAAVAAPPKQQIAEQPRVSEPKPVVTQPAPVVAPAPTSTTTVATKGAGKLMAQNDPNVLHVNARELPRTQGAPEISAAQVETPAK